MGLIPALTWLMCTFVWAAGPTAGPFQDLSIEEALKQAKKDGQLVYIDFHATWCGVCKRMHAGPYQDPQVINWLKRNTVAISLDAEEEVEAAKKYTVRSYPTTVFLKADGSLAAILRGGYTSEQLLTRAAMVRQGKDAAALARQDLQDAGFDDPSARMTYAGVLAQTGNHAEALKHYLWCFDSGHKHDPEFADERLDDVPEQIALLGKQYPPALDALRERRDTRLERVLKSRRQPSASTSLEELVALNEGLDEEAKNLELYDSLRAEFPDSPAVGFLRHAVFPQLRKAKRYAEVLADTDPEKELAGDLAAAKRKIGNLTGDKKVAAEQRAQQKFLEKAGNYYEAALALKRLDLAERLAALTLAHNSEPRTFRLLAWHGYKSGAPIAANLEQARKAHELSQGKDATIVATLARVLNALDQQDEACRVLSEARTKLRREREATVIQQCAKDLGCPAAGGKSTTP